MRCSPANANSTISSEVPALLLPRFGGLYLPAILNLNLSNVSLHGQTISFGDLFS